MSRRRWSDNSVFGGSRRRRGSTTGGGAARLGRSGGWTPKRRERGISQGAAEGGNRFGSRVVVQSDRCGDAQSGQSNQDGWDGCRGSDDSGRWNGLNRSWGRMV